MGRVNDEVRKETGASLYSLLVGVVLSLTLLIVAIVQAVQGDWLPAIFFLIWWHGYTNNQTQVLNMAQFRAWYKNSPSTVNNIFNK